MQIKQMNYFQLVRLRHDEQKNIYLLKILLYIIFTNYDVFIIIDWSREKFLDNKQIGNQV